MELNDPRMVMMGQGAMSGTNIELWSGHMLDLTNVRCHDIRREDIVVGLSNCCRYAGQCRRFYSVAEHSVLVADLLRHQGYTHECQLAGLLHDGAESYIGDMTAPLKAIMRAEDARALSSAYDRVGAALDAVIFERFGLTWTAGIEKAVKRADLWAFRIEAGALLASHGNGSGYRVPDEIAQLGGLPANVMWYAGLDPIDARDYMRDRWDELDAYMEEDLT